MPSLLDLSAELKLIIIEQMAADDQPESRKELDDDEDEEEAEKRHPKRERDWPILSLSCTCKVLRTLCAPFVFRSLGLENNEKSAASVQSIADGPYAELVHKLRFRANMKPLMYNAPREELSDVDFPPSVENVLRNLETFPKLEHLAIKLSAGHENFDLYPDDQTEDWEEAVSAEQREGWRAVMKQTYAAIAQNHNHGTLKHLEFEDMVGKQVSTWQDESFRLLLGRLDRLTISLMGGDNGAGWCMNTNDWYGDFVIKMSGFFFDNLSNVTSLSLSASTQGPTGLDGWRHAPVPLYAWHMPKLRSLFLKHNFIGPQLIEFIRGHVGVLESVHLDECYSGMNCSMAEGAITWAHFFTSIERAQPSALRSFEVTPIHATFDGSKYGDTTDEDAARVEKELSANPGRHFFAYSVLDDKYGMLFEDFAARGEAFEAGADQAALDRLMAVVASNIKKKNEQ